MRKAETILAIIRKHGQQKLPVKDVYRMLYQQDLYLRAYGKIYRNKGAMTEGITQDTVDGMSMEKINKTIALLRNEQYRWTPVRRTYITKKNGKLRPLGLPTWSDKLLQQVIKTMLEAYYEPNFSDHSHGFRPNRGCHTALKEIVQKGKGTKWFIEGDLCACFDKIDHTILLNILTEHFHDNRFIRLISAMLKAGYLENWKFNKTFSGVPQGSIAGPILSNVILDKLDKYVEEHLIPSYTRGLCRKMYPPYSRLKRQISIAKKEKNWTIVRELYKQLQSLPSRDPKDPNFRRLCYVRYADDFLLGLIGPKNDAIKIRNDINNFLLNSLKLVLNSEKTLITHARDQKAKFLGYEIHVLYENSQHDNNGKRCINGKIGLRVPITVSKEKCSQYMQHGKPIHLAQRISDDPYSIISQYQAEYRGIVQYYRMAYNLCMLNYLKHIMEVSLVKTLASKYKTTCTKIYKQYGAKITTNDGEYKVILCKIKRTSPKKPLITYFGGISLKWNKQASINEEPPEPIWIRRVEIVKRLLAQKCEICGSQEQIEVHHIRKLADLKQKGKTIKPKWVRYMSERKRKTLVVCYKCHNNIHYGRYNGGKLSA